MIGLIIFSFSAYGNSSEQAAQKKREDYLLEGKYLQNERIEEADLKRKIENERLERKREENVRLQRKLDDDRWDRAHRK